MRVGGKTIKYAWGVIENYMKLFNAEEIKFYDAVFLWWRLENDCGEWQKLGDEGIMNENIGDSNRNQNSSLNVSFNIKLS